MEVTLAHHLQSQLHLQGLAALVSLEDCSLEDMLHVGYAILTLCISIISHVSSWMSFEFNDFLDVLWSDVDFSSRSLGCTFCPQISLRVCKHPLLKDWGMVFSVWIRCYSDNQASTIMFCFFCRRVITGPINTHPQSVLVWETCRQNQIHQRYNDVPVG